MVEPGTVRRLLETIEDRLGRLNTLAAVPLDEYIADRDIQDRVERNLEVAIQACIDLALHVLADQPTPVPETNRAAFAALAGALIVQPDLAARLGTMAGFRNLLVHGYSQLDPALVHGTLARLDDIRAFVGQVTTYLKGRSG